MTVVLLAVAGNGHTHVMAHAEVCEVLGFSLSCLSLLVV
jgi:hypothetical protein